MQSPTFVAAEKRPLAAAPQAPSYDAPPSGRPPTFGRRSASTPPATDLERSPSPALRGVENPAPTRGRPPTPVDPRGRAHALAVATPTLLDAALSRLAHLSLHAGGAAPPDLHGTPGVDHAQRAGDAVPVTAALPAAPATLRPPLPFGPPPRLGRRPCASLPPLPSARAAALLDPPRPRASTLPRDGDVAMLGVEVGRPAPQPPWHGEGALGLSFGAPPAWPAASGAALLAAGRPRPAEDAAARAQADDGPRACKRQRSRH